jgi:hypothetical protein
MAPAKDWSDEHSEPWLPLDFRFIFAILASDPQNGKRQAALLPP